MHKCTSLLHMQCAGATRNGAHVMDAGCGRLVPADQCEGRPPARARLLSSPAKPPVQMHCKRSQIGHMLQAGREPLLQFLCVLPPVYTARLAAESGLRLVCACTTTRDRRCLRCAADAFRSEKRDPPAKRPCRGFRASDGPRQVHRRVHARNQASTRAREVSTSKRLTP